ncbi:Double-stranded RNA binding motif [Carpediemonas membranifera]|uniref:Double-stranded RNA binding motif n=1 Tax=Carpediemonas membranifera TaxID=201153 RepID=A0A8J6AY31_9EUKA|nr:Double-stranded RNA binding motif [Carpediemonas membranifera]|eukprot:KAG9394305.1 Double-stranded RNA binding motif [Carpediemonas membranifera]
MQQKDLHKIQAELSKLFGFEWKFAVVEELLAYSDEETVESGRLLFNSALSVLAIEHKVNMANVLADHGLDRMKGIAAVYKALSAPDVLKLTTEQLQTRFPKVFYYLVREDGCCLSRLLAVIADLDIIPLFRAQTTTESVLKNEDEDAIEEPGHNQVINPPPGPDNVQLLPPSETYDAFWDDKAGPDSDTGLDGMSSVSHSGRMPGPSLPRHIQIPQNPANSFQYTEGINYKGVLNEFSQKMGIQFPTYETRRRVDRGQCGGNFVCAIRMTMPDGEEVCLNAVGITKKDAEFRAACRLIFLKLADDLVLPH